MEPEHITLDDVLNAYKSGLFPMAEERDAIDFYWYDPVLRGQLSINRLIIPKKLKQAVLRGPYDIRINTAFKETIEGCAGRAPDRPETWINTGIRNLFAALHHAGHAHSIEAWKGNSLVGGLYGLAIGGAFFGESMFSRADNASKICLVHLCARLWKGGFTLLDTQFINDHLLQFGAYEISRNEYLKELENALRIDASFSLAGTKPEDEKSLVEDYLEHRKRKTHG